MRPVRFVSMLLAIVCTSVWMAPAAQAAPSFSEKTFLVLAMNNLLGTPYRMGSGPRKPSQYRQNRKPPRIDCSSYVWYTYYRAFRVNIDPTNAIESRAGVYTDSIWTSASSNSSMSKTAGRGIRTFRIPRVAGRQIGDIVLLNDPTNDGQPGQAIIDHVVIMGVSGQVFQASSSYGTTNAMLWSDYKKKLDSWGYEVYGTVRLNSLWN